MSSNSTRFNKLLDIVVRDDTVKGKRALKRKLVEMIRRGEVEPEQVLLSITTKMASTNPSVVILSIDILDSWMMTCGRLIQDEIVKVGNMDKLKEILENTENRDIRAEILHLIYDWSETLEDPFIGEMVELLKRKGFEFPQESDTSPGMYSENCYRCFVNLNFQNIKHCEICEKTFCTACMVTKTYGHGIIKLVCGDCEQLIGNQSEISSSFLSGIENWNFSQNFYPSEESEKEDEELYLAMALSKSELAAGPTEGPSTSSDSKYTPSQCTICYEERVDSMLHPCSHLCMCFNCASEQWKGVGNGCCPLCRIPIEEVTRVK